MGVRSASKTVSGLDSGRDVMPGLESAAIALGTALTKLACDMWLGKDTVAGTVGSNAIDVVAERFTNTRCSPASTSGLTAPFRNGSAHQPPL